MSKLENGMIFKNAREMCEFVGIKYDVDHAPRIYKRLACYCEFHRTENKNIVIDKVFLEPDFSNYEKRNNDYIYNIGDVFNTPSGKVNIIKKIRYGNKNRKTYICKCLICQGEYPRYEYNLKKNIGCPFCAGKEVLIGYNDMWTTVPETAKLLLNSEDGYNHTKCSGDKVDWKCPICNNIIKNKTISNITNSGLSCPCSKSKSYPNRFMYWLLTNIGIDFEDEKIFKLDDLKYRKYDFYIPSLSCIIEMNGKQHYEEVNFTSRSLVEEQENDLLKENLASFNDILNYIVIESKQSNFEYIKKNVLKSDLCNLIDLSIIDWDFVKIKAETNIIFEIAKMWNEGEYDLNIIGKNVGLTRGIITLYMHKCDEYGLLKYDKKKTRKIGNESAQKKMYQNKANPMMCNENGLYFGSLQICKNVMEEITGLKFSHGNINGTMTGRYSHHHHFTFQYITREEFNTIKTQSPELAFGDFFILPEETKEEQNIA